MIDAERVAFLIDTLNNAIGETGLTIVGTTTSPFALRVVRADQRMTPEHLGPSVDAVHLVWSPARRSHWISGAEHRALTDPTWAAAHWPERMRRPDGNEPVPVGGFVPVRKGGTELVRKPLVLEGMLDDESIDCATDAIPRLTLDGRALVDTDLTDLTGHRVRITVEDLDADAP